MVIAQNVIDTVVPNIGNKISNEEKSKTHAIEEEFQNIQQNLLEVSGKNTAKEAIEYYNLGELFMKQNKPLLAKSYYLESLDIHERSKNTQEKRKTRFSKKSKAKKGFNEFNAYLGLIHASLEAKTPKDALKYTEQADKKYRNNQELLLLKLDVLQANKMWQDILDVCDVLSLKKHSKEVDSILINKRTLAKAKLGLDKEFIFNSNVAAKDDVSEKSFSIDDDITRDEEELEVPLDINNNISQGYFNSENLDVLSYETQDELANTFNQQNELDKELIIREEISKKPNVSEQQKAKQKLEIAKIYSKKEKSKQAISALKESLKLAKESKDIPLQKETLLKLIDLYEKGKDDKNIIKYYKELRVLDVLEDSLNLKKYNEALTNNSNILEQQEAIKNIQERRDLYQKEKSLENIESSLTKSQLKFQKIVIACLILGLLIAIFVLRWYHKQRQRLKMVNLQLELKNMRNQMNPHFIFNSLNAVNHFIAQRNELLANEYLTEFALLMRNTLNQSDLDLIPLRDELTFLNRYCELEKMRFENKFDFTFTVDPSINIDAYEIPPLLLQPFVENAVWHGLRYLEDKGMLDVMFTQVDDQLKIEISDNGIGREKSTALKTNNQKKHKSKGVSLIKRRIHISNQLTNIHINWNVKDNDPQGTRVILFLSKKK